MPNVSSDYNLYSIHKMIIDNLAEDGALCNSSTKEYDK